MILQQEAGIYSSAIGFGLGITLSDFNDDNWTDIFISNDFFERDYFYLNNQKGGFIESLKTILGQFPWAPWVPMLQIWTMIYYQTLWLQKCFLPPWKGNVPKQYMSPGTSIP